MDDFTGRRFVWRYDIFVDTCLKSFFIMGLFQLYIYFYCIQNLSKFGNNICQIMIITNISMLGVNNDVFIQFAHIIFNIFNICFFFSGHYLKNETDNFYLLINIQTYYTTLIWSILFSYQICHQIYNNSCFLQNRYTNNEQIQIIVNLSPPQYSAV